MARCTSRHGFRHCYREATGEDGLCTPHRTGLKTAQRAKAAREEHDKSIRAKWERQENQAAFIAAWRAAHPDESYSRPAVCDLCGKAIQVVGADIYASTYQEMAKHHKEHGTDWGDLIHSYRNNEEA